MKKRPYFISYTIEIFGINPKLLINTACIEHKVEEFIKEMSIKVIEEIHHDFKPYGATISYIISNSHLTVHTWPENEYLHIYLLSCKSISKSNLNKVIQKVFPEKEFKISKHL